MKRLRSAVIEAILIQFGHAKSLDYDKLKTVVLSVDISDFAKKEMLDRLRFIVDSLSAHEDINDRYDCYYESLLHLSGTVGVFSSWSYLDVSVHSVYLLYTMDSCIDTKDFTL